MKFKIENTDTEKSIIVSGVKREVEGFGRFLGEFPETPKINRIVLRPGEKQTVSFPCEYIVGVEEL